MDFCLKQSSGPFFSFALRLFGIFTVPNKSEERDTLQKSGFNSIKESGWIHFMVQLFLKIFFGKFFLFVEYFFEIKFCRHQTPFLVVIHSLGTTKL